MSITLRELGGGISLQLWHTNVNVNLRLLKCPIVLVSARIELIFFLVAGIVQCFEFSRKIMLITH